MTMCMLIELPASTMTLICTVTVLMIMLVILYNVNSYG